MFRLPILFAQAQREKESEWRKEKILRKTTFNDFEKATKEHSTEYNESKTNEGDGSEKSCFREKLNSIRQERKTVKETLIEFEWAEIYI